VSKWVQILLLIVCDVNFLSFHDGSDMTQEVWDKPTNFVHFSMAKNIAEWSQWGHVSMTQSILNWTMPQTCKTLHADSARENDTVQTIVKKLSAVQAYLECDRGIGGCWTLNECCHHHSIGIRVVYNSVAVKCHCWSVSQSAVFARSQCCPGPSGNTLRNKKQFYLEWQKTTAALNTLAVKKNGLLKSWSTKK
jgi:hypothetical protein